MQIAKCKLQIFQTRLAASSAILPFAICIWQSVFCNLTFLAAAEPAPLPDPLPLRRLLISPERLPFELQRARQGALVQMPREEFEARVAEAARAGAAIKNPPHLVEARYHASLVDSALVGTGQWTIANPGSAAAILHLGQLNLALRQVRSDKQETSPADVILGDLDGKSLGLLVKRP